MTDGSTRKFDGEQLFLTENFRRRIFYREHTTKNIGARGPRKTVMKECPFLARLSCSNELLSRKDETG